MDINKLIDDIVSKRKHELSKKISRYQKKNPILSQISDCDREIVYQVLNWDKKPLHNESLQARFDVGNLMEREIIIELEKIGFHVILSQMPVAVTDKHKNILATGKIDGFIKYDGLKYPMEIKTMNQNMFNSIKTYEDFRKKPYMRKYIRQLQMYLFGNNMEQGLFLLSNCLGAWKLIPVYLDYGECELILKRLEKIYQHIKDKKYPDKIPYDPQICGKCDFSHICLCDIKNQKAEMIESPEFEEELVRHEELRPLATEYKNIHDKIRDITKDIETVIVGTRFILTNVPSSRTTYELPEDAAQEINLIKKQFAKKVPCKRLHIEDLENK